MGIVSTIIKKAFSSKSEADYGIGIVSTLPEDRFLNAWNKGKGLGRIGESDFKLYKQQYLTDPVVQTNINIVCKYLFKDGYVIVGGEEEDNTLIKEFFKENDFSNLGFLWIKDAKIFGTGYLEFPDNKERLILRGAEKMYIEVDDHGRVEKYIQKPTFDPRTWIEFEPDEIVCFKNNPFSDSVYGISDIESIKYLVSYMKDQAERDVVMMLNKFVGDRFKVKAGTVDRPYSQRKLTEIKEFFSELTQGEDLIFAGDIEIDTLRLEGKGPDFRQYLDYILMELAIGMGVPTVFWLPQGSTEASARVSLRVFESDIRFFQETIENKINMEIIPQKVGKKDNMPLFKFNPINLEDLLLAARTDLIYASQGIKSPEEIRRERGFEDFIIDGKPFTPPEEPEDPGGIGDNIPGDRRGKEVGINKKIVEKEIDDSI